MQLVRAMGTAALFFLLGAQNPVPAAQEQQKKPQGKPEKHQEARPPAQKERGQGHAPQPQAREQQQQRQQQSQQQRVPPPQAQRAQQYEGSPAPQVRRPEQLQRSQQQAMAWQQQRGWIRQGGWQGQKTWQQGRAERWDIEHRNWSQRGGYGGYYIPQDRFLLSFGSGHGFRMRSQPTMYMGYPRFSYGGFSFLLLDRWPEYWAENWYADDDVYVDYEDGYYLYNRRYPRVRLAITVVL